MTLGSQKAIAFVLGVLLSACLFTSFRAPALRSLSEECTSNKLPQNHSVSSKNITSDNLVITRTSQKYLFTKNASRFVDVFASCLFDENCHLFYHHVQKTGGTFIASTFYPILNQQKYVSKVWCCNDLMMKRFERNTPRYCNLRLGVYEVIGSQFQEVVETCHAHYKNQTKKKQRAIALVTVREPVQRIVSGIHQRCNKGLSKLTPEWQRICQQCSYYNATDYWDEMVEKNNLIYEELNYDLPIDLLVLDTLMIDRFLQLLEKKLSVRIPRGIANEERKNVCDFHVPSEMFKKLVPAQLAYRKILTEEPDAMGWPEANQLLGS